MSPTSPTSTSPSIEPAILPATPVAPVAPATPVAPVTPIIPPAISPLSTPAAFEIQDPEIDTEALMRLIQERIRQRSKDALDRGQRYGLPASARSVRRLPTALYQAVEQTRATANTIRVPLVVTGGGASGWPVLGKLLQRVRRALHQVSLFYTNLLADRQITFNRATSDTLRQLTAALDQANERVESLERQVAELRDKQL